MKADIVVVGAGALGLSTALHCALAGRSVVVAERHGPGSQASGRAAGLFKSVQADELRTTIARRSIALALTFADWSGAQLEVARSGSFLVARTDAHKEFLRTEEHQSRGWGAQVRVAAPSELADRAAYFHGTGSDLAVWCPEDIYIAEPTDLVQAYVAACRLHGVVLLDHEPVTAVTLSGGQVAGAETTMRSITAPVVVDAAGAWTRQVAAMAAADAAVAPVRHQLLITSPTADVAADDAIVRVVDAAVYLRPARGGLMVGGFESSPLAVQAPGESTDEVPLDLDVLRKLAGQVEREVPSATAAVAEHRGGLFTMSPDGRFLAGPVPDVPGLWIASGCNGSGFSSSPALGEALAGWITAAAGRLDISALAPGRFGTVTSDALVKAGVWQYEHYYDPSPHDPPAAGVSGVV